MKNARIKKVSSLLSVLSMLFGIILLVLFVFGTLNSFQFLIIVGTFN